MEAIPSMHFPVAGSIQLTRQDENWVPAVPRLSLYLMYPHPGEINAIGGFDS